MVSVSGGFGGASLVRRLCYPSNWQNLDTRNITAKRLEEEKKLNNREALVSTCYSTAWPAGCSVSGLDSVGYVGRDVHMLHARALKCQL